MEFQTYFLLFIFYSALGWIVESGYANIKNGKIINRGFLIGPWLPIYGWGALAITIFLRKYIDDPIALFVMSMIICSLLEYITSYVLEKIFKVRWWDYSDMKYNINGRICLETMIPFGILALLVMYIINPFVQNILNIIPNFWLNLITVVLFTLYLIDNIISFKYAEDLKKIDFDREKDNTEEIKENMKKQFEKRKKIYHFLNEEF